MTGVAVLAVDRLGRRPLLLGGVSGMVSPYISLHMFGWLIFQIKNIEMNGCDVWLVTEIVRPACSFIFYFLK